MNGRETTITDDELTHPAKHLFLSPHYDDIALSCGGTARRLRELGQDPEVAIVFGAEPDPENELTAFATAMHIGWGMDAHDVIASRRAEEAAAAAVLGTNVSFLPFHDAIYRGERYLNDPELFGEVRADEFDLAAAIISVLELDGAERSSTRIYAPLAIGWHVDHQIVFHAGVDLGASGWDVWFYEDLPYALKRGLSVERIERVEIDLTTAALVAVDATWTAKIDAVMAYPSQLETIFRYVDSGSSRVEIDELLRDYASSAGDGIAVERFWRASRADVAFVRGFDPEFNMATKLV